MDKNIGRKIIVDELRIGYYMGFYCDNDGDMCIVYENAKTGVISNTYLRVRFIKEDEKERGKTVV